MLNLRQHSLREDLSRQLLTAQLKIQTSLLNTGIVRNPSLAELKLYVKAGDQTLSRRNFASLLRYTNKLLTEHGQSPLKIERDLGAANDYVERAYRNQLQVRKRPPSWQELVEAVQCSQPQTKWTFGKVRAAFREINSRRSKNSHPELKIGPSNVRKVSQEQLVTALKEFRAEFGSRPMRSELLDRLRQSHPHFGLNKAVLQRFFGGLTTADVISKGAITDPLELARNFHGLQQAFGHVPHNHDLLQVMQLHNPGIPFTHEIIKFHTTELRLAAGGKAFRAPVELEDLSRINRRLDKSAHTFRLIQRELERTLTALSSFAVADLAALGRAMILNDSAVTRLPALRLLLELDAPPALQTSAGSLALKEIAGQLDPASFTAFGYDPSDSRLAYYAIQGLLKTRNGLDLSVDLLLRPAIRSFPLQRLREPVDPYHAAKRRLNSSPLEALEYTVRSLAYLSQL